MGVERTYTRRELATLLQVHEKTVKRWLKAGRLPAPLPLGGRTLRWRHADVVQLLGEMAGQQGQDEQADRAA